VATSHPGGVGSRHDLPSGVVDPDQLDDDVSTPITDAHALFDRTLRV
jgi:hypothetical protein